MATVQDVVLELTNNRNFYKAFTCVLRTAYENKYKFSKRDAGDTSINPKPSFRRDMVQEIKRYYGTLPFPNKTHNSEVIAELVSHYSDEVFGFYVPVDQALDFMTDGWELAPKKIDEPDQVFKYARRLTKSYSGPLVVGKIYRFLPQTKHSWYTLDEDREKWTSNLERDSTQWYVVPEHEYLKQEAGSHIDTAIESFEQVTQTLKQTKQENNMNPSNIIKTKIIVFGDDAADLTDDQLFGKVQSVEAEIERLDSVKNKPEKLKARIKEMQDQLTVLIEYTDSRD